MAFVLRPSVSPSRPVKPQATQAHHAVRHCRNTGPAHNATSATARPPSGGLQAFREFNSVAAAAWGLTLVTSSYSRAAPCRPQPPRGGVGNVRLTAGQCTARGARPAPARQAVPVAVVVDQPARSAPARRPRPLGPGPPPPVPAPGPLRCRARDGGARGEAERRADVEKKEKCAPVRDRARAPCAGRGGGGPSGPASKPLGRLWEARPVQVGLQLEGWPVASKLPGTGLAAGFKICAWGAGKYHRDVQLPTYLSTTTTIRTLCYGICQGMSWQHLHQPCVAGMV